MKHNVFTYNDNGVASIKHRNSNMMISNNSGHPDQILFRGDLHELPLGGGHPVFTLDDGLVVMKMTDSSYAIWFMDDDE